MRNHLLLIISVGTPLRHKGPPKDRKRQKEFCRSRKGAETIQAGDGTRCGAERGGLIQKHLLKNHIIISQKTFHLIDKKPSLLKRGAKKPPFLIQAFKKLPYKKK